MATMQLVCSLKKTNISSYIVNRKKTFKTVKKITAGRFLVQNETVPTSQEITEHQNCFHLCAPEVMVIK